MKLSEWVESEEAAKLKKTVIKQEQLQLHETYQRWSIGLRNVPLPLLVRLANGTLQAWLESASQSDKEVLSDRQILDNDTFLSHLLHVVIRAIGSQEITMMGIAHGSYTEEYLKDPGEADLVQNIAKVVTPYWQGYTDQEVRAGAHKEVKPRIDNS